MVQSDDRAIAIRNEVDLDRARAGRYRRAFALPAPGEHDPTEGNDLDVFAPSDFATGYVDAEDSPGPRVDLGGDALPAHELDRIGEVAKDDVGARRDPNLALDRGRID